MRPVLLEMAGFAAFREPTSVDFAGAEYFALVGPTGAGKSTVIDAMTFALYGSVPRWDDRRAVSLALAPTVGRGTVRLVFDLGGARYVVARELRRAASGGVSVRSARLERLRDPAALGGPEDETEPLADGAGPVTKAVEELLGLPFGDFCTCVVLPQGEFAEFLHTEPRKRQEKLVRILGLGVYDVIAREANSEAAAQRQRAEVLTEQLGAYADATAEAAATAAARVGELEALAGRVAVAVPELVSTAAALEAAQVQVHRLREERSRLAALAVPAGLDDLAARHRAARGGLATAGAAAIAAEEADTTARELQAAAPERGTLERVRREHAELARCDHELPGATERHEKARAAFGTAAGDAADALRGAESARSVRDSAAAALAEVIATGRRLAAERDMLRAPQVPAGLDALDRRRAAAAAALTAADTALATAEHAEAEARAALAGARPRGPLEQARRDLAELGAVQHERAGAVERATAAREGAEQVGTLVAEARHRREHAEAARTAAQRADLAAALRPALVAGDPCPVCEQAVATLPAPLSAVDGAATDTAAADRAAAEADARYEEARRREGSAVAALARVDAEVERLDTSLARLRTGLEGVLGAVVPSAAEVDAALHALDALVAGAESAAGAVRGARRARDGAAAEAEAVRTELGAATEALRAERDKLVAFGAPAHATDVLAAWQSLVGWAAVEVAAREDALVTARAEHAEADTARAAAEQELLAAEQAVRQRRADETAAARAEEEARGRAETIARRAAELRSALDGAPSDAEAAAELARIDELTAAARAADTALRTARAALRTAEAAAAATGREVDGAWEALRAARDPLVPLGAPAVAAPAPDADLLAAWEALVGWSRAAAEARAEQLAAAEEGAAAAVAARDAAGAQLAADLVAHQVEAVPPLVQTAQPAVARVLERARGASERIAERRAAAASLAADRDEAESAQQVAKMLGGLLRSDGFPRWLVASALDALVADASASLAELSGGQFELTHAGGEFLVIDHADADAQRPVKTLSGGETFQASLALALALSAQMSGLAAKGAARLESIFLDEGFGTLDEANLETVASTLENLATRGDRMVGVITHVPALAERVPVRFVVNRDQRTSSVVREGT